MGFRDIQPQICLIRIEIPPENMFPVNPISIGSRRLVGFRGKGTSDSSSPCRITPTTAMNPHTSVPLPLMFFWTWHIQTNPQTIFFIRSSLQSSEQGFGSFKVQFELSAWNHVENGVVRKNDPQPLNFTFSFTSNRISSWIDLGFVICASKNPSLDFLWK